MLRIKTFREVTQFRMGTNFFGRTLYQVCSYLVDGLMIDTGCYGCKKEFEEACQNYDINQAIITHYHEDHRGNGWYFAQEGIPVWADIKTSRVLEKGFGALPFYRRFVWRTPPAFPVRVVGDKIDTEHHVFNIIHTPGHSADHICLYEAKEGWLFTGDHFLSERVKVSGYEENFYQALESLYSIKQLELSTMFCSLGRIINNPRKAIEEKIQFMEETADKIRGLNKKGFEIKEIVKLVLGTDYFGKYITGGDLSKKNFVQSVLQNDNRFTNCI